MLSPLVEAARGEPLLEPALRIAVQSDVELVVESELGTFVFDLQRRVVRHGGGDAVDFASVRSVDIGAFPGGRGEPSWSVSLYLGVLRRVALGRTYDDGAASVIGARLARALGCKVVALALRG